MRNFLEIPPFTKFPGIFTPLRNFLKISPFYEISWNFHPSKKNNSWKFHPFITVHILAHFLFPLFFFFLCASGRNPDKYRSVSAFSAICNPVACPWGKKAFTGYLGADEAAWRVSDVCCPSGGYTDPDGQ